VPPVKPLRRAVENRRVVHIPGRSTGPIVGPGEQSSAMSLLPDPVELRALAQRIDHHAFAARARAVRLGDAIAATRWHGVAARAFDVQAAAALGALRAAAYRLNDAADALRRHADRVGTVLNTLENMVQAGLTTAEDLLAAGGDLVGDALDVVGL
jgi:hypothetical protein